MPSTQTTFQETTAATSGAFTGQYLWSNAANWTNGVPGNGDSVETRRWATTTSRA